VPGPSRPSRDPQPRTLTSFPCTNGRHPGRSSARCSLFTAGCPGPRPWRLEIDTTKSDDSRLVDNQAEHHYELWVGDERVGTIKYSTLPDAIVLIHTEVDPAFEGKGFGSRLVHDALADVRSRGLKIVPLCSFVRSYLQRHPDEADVPRRRRQAD
jgi:predicted GNAT family acetyltransferase